MLIAKQTETYFLFCIWSTASGQHIVIPFKAEVVYFKQQNVKKNEHKDLQRKNRRKIMEQITLNSVIILPRVCSASCCFDNVSSANKKNNDYNCCRCCCCCIERKMVDCVQIPPSIQAAWIFICSVQVTMRMNGGKRLLAWPRQHILPLLAYFYLFLSTVTRLSNDLYENKPRRTKSPGLLKWFRLINFTLAKYQMGSRFLVFPLASSLLVVCFSLSVSLSI